MFTSWLLASFIAGRLWCFLDGVWLLFCCTCLFLLFGLLIGLPGLVVVSLLCLTRVCGLVGIGRSCCEFGFVVFWVVWFVGYADLLRGLGLGLGCWFGFVFMAICSIVDLFLG